MTHEPDFTIGMPVRNGGEQIRTALDSLLGQTKGDFRLVISDNKSTDGTLEVCQGYAARDRRITVVAQPVNLGICGNFRFVLMQATTPFFMWACHDDCWSPTFAERNHTNLVANPGAVNSVSKVAMVTVEGLIAPSRGTAPLRGPPEQRLKDFFLSPSDASRFYGLFRTEALKRSFPENIDVFGYDWIVLALSLLEGEHLELAETLLQRDDHAVDHYHRSLVRAEPRAVYRMLPHLAMALTLKRVLPPTYWEVIKPRVARRNLIEALMYARHHFPAIKPVLRRLATIERALQRRHITPGDKAGVG